MFTTIVSGSYSSSYFYLKHWKLYVFMRGSVVVKALCYKPEGRGFDTRLDKFLNLPNPSGHPRPWGLLSL
jgi:hypothetical protein